jgi:predicted secreted Zn-dependent protease
MMMAEPITTALIVGLAAQKFAEGAAGKAAEKLVERLWEAIATRFKGRKKTEENLAAIAASKGQDAGAIEAVTTVLAGEFVEDEELKADLEGLAQQIIQIQQQNQMQQQNTNYGRDQIIINQPTGNLKIGGA